MALSSRHLHAAPRSLRGAFAPLLLVAVLLLLVPVHVGAQVEAAAAAQSWLLSSQSEDGGFGAVPALRVRDTGAALAALAPRANGGADGTAVERGLIYLAGAPERAAEPSARRIEALALAGRPVGPFQNALLGLRNHSGFGAFGAHGTNLFDTALAARALAADEDTHLLEIASLLDYLRLHQNPDGGWGYVPGDPSGTYLSAEIALALAAPERLAPSPQTVAAATGYLASRQLPDGSFGSALETATAYRALVALGADLSALAASPVDALLATQRADGSWDGDVFTTAQVLRALGGELPDLAVVESSAAPEEILPGEPVTVSATVANRGTEPARATTLEVRLGDASGEVLASTPVAELAPGERATVDLLVETAGLPADGGELLLVAVADAAGEVEEESEEDNRRTLRIRLVTEPDLALYPSDLTPVPERPAPDDELLFRVAARNQGETEVASFSWRLSELVGGAPTVLAAGTAGPAAPGAGALIEVPLTLAEGEHILRVELDPEDAVAEARESNNVAEAALFVVDDTLADLAVAEADLVAAPPLPAEGEGVTATATVRNLGAAAATAAVRIWDGEPGAGTLLTEQTVSVDAGGSAQVTALFTAGPDTVVLWAEADPADAVRELSETNNRARRFVADRPDPAVGRDNLDLAPAAPLAGETVRGRLTVRNAGPAPAAAVDVAVWDGPPEAGGTEVFRTALTDLPAGGNRAVDFQWTAVAGLRELVAVVDPDDLVEELSEGNNRVVREVAVPRDTGPDLVISAADLSGLVHDPLTLAATGTVTASVANVGDAPADAFVVRAFEDRDGDGRPSAGDPELASASVPGVAAGGSAAVELPFGATLRFHRPLVWLEVDAGDLVPERREDDNRRPLFADCSPQTAPASFEAVEEWVLRGLEVESTPVVVQLSDDDGDGRIDSRDVPDVVFHTEDAGGRAITARSGLDGSELWTFRSTAANPLAGRLANLAAADLDGDGVAEVIGVQSNRRLVALDRQGRVRWVSDQVESAGGRSWAGAPVVGDLTGDGVPEIAVGRSVVSNSGRLIGQGTGNVGRNHNYYGPFGAPYLIDAPLSVIADVDLDGRNELVAGDSLYRLIDGALEIVWDRTVPDHLMVDGFVAVANLDSDPEGEIVYVSSNRVMILHHDGSVYRSHRSVQPYVPFGERTFWAGPPSIGDLDGDGRPEILVTAQKELRAFTSDLATLWRVPTTEMSEMSVATPFDLDGDGADEVLVLDHTDFRILDGATGTTLYSRPNLSKTGTEGPAVADVDSDGRAEILLPSNRSFGGDASTQGLHVLGHPSWAGTRPVWSQHTFRGDDVLADGTVAAGGRIPAQRFRTNRALPAPERRPANLTLGLPRVGRTGADGVPITLRVGNGGLETVPPGVRVALYDTDPSTAAPVAEGFTAGALPPGAYEDLTILWRVAGSAGQAAWAAVDPDDERTECDETDNGLSFVVEESVLADLAVPAGGVSAAAPLVAGQRVPVTVTVENAGAATAEAVGVGLWDGDPGAHLAGGTFLGETTISSLGPGEATTVAIPWDTLALGSLPGTHALHAVADAAGTVVEAVEENNRGLLEVALAAADRPDPAVAGFSVTPDAVEAGAEVLFSVEVVNRGAPLDVGTEVAFLVNRAEVGRASSPAVLATGGRVILELPVSTAGRSGLLEAAVRIDPDSSVAEVSEQNNRATAELRVSGSSLALAVATDAASYAPGETVALTVTADNLGADARTADLRLAIVDSAGVEVAEVAAQPVTLAPGATELSFHWGTGSHVPGGYAAVAELTAAGSPLARAETLFSVERQVAVDARLYADRDVYPPTGTAALAGRVASASTNTLLRDLSARLAVTDASGAEVFAAERAIPVLYPGSDTPVEALWEIAGAPAGAYTASLSVRDAGGLLLAYASAPLTVEDSADTGAGISGDLAVAPEVVGIGAPVRFDYSVENGGNADLSDLVLRVDLASLADGTVAGSVSARRSLVRGEVVTGSLGSPTGELAPGEYLATLFAVLPGSPATEVLLDRAALTAGPGVSVADAATAEGDSGSSLLRFRLTLSEPSEAEVTVDWATADGTATAGEDYAAASGTATFAPGATEAAVDVEIFGDIAPEADEVFLLTLSEPVGALGGDLQALGVLRDEEGCPSANLLADPAAEEGSFDDPAPGWQPAPADGWVRRLADPTPLEGAASFAATAAAELVQTVDLAPYAARIDAGGQSFLAGGFVRTAVAADGVTAETGSLAVEYLDAAGAVLDAFDSGPAEALEGWRAVVDLRPAPAGTRGARLTLTASGAGVAFDRLGLRSIGAPTASIAAIELLEGDSGATSAVFTARLSCAQPVPVRLDWTTADGTATAPGDYQPASGTLSIAAGETSGTVEVQVAGDTLDEPDETFGLELSTPDDVVLLTPRPGATIVDDDGPATLSVRDLALPEGDGAGEAVVSVTLSSVSGKLVTASWATADAAAIDPATAGEDYAAASGTLTLEPGQTETTVSVALAGDRLNEPDEVFLVRLSSPSAAVLGDEEAAVTLLDDDPVEIRAGDVSVVEGDSGTVEARFPVTLSVPSVYQVSAAWATSDLDGGAVAGVDYIASSGTLTWAPGETEAFAAVQISGDTVKEPLEAFLLAVSSPVNGTLADPEAVGSIVDDDGILISVDDVTAREGAGAEAVFTVRLNKATTVDVSASYATADGSAVAGADYRAASGTVLIPAGRVAAQIRVPILDDGTYEPLETFTLALSAPSGEAILLDPEAEATLLDDDGWHLNGHADDAAIPGCIVLTPDVTWRRGTAWNKTLLDLTRSFDKTFRVYLGERDSDGGEGMYFALQSQGSGALGGGGGSEGYLGVRPSIAIELDTVTDTRFFGGVDHMSVGRNGYEHAGHEPVPLPLDDIEDGREHELRVTWNAVTHTFDVHFEGEETLTYTEDVISGIFGGAPEVFWGFTGATGGRRNLEYFCDTARCLDDDSTVLVSVGDARVVEGDDGTAQLHFPVTLSCPSAEPVTVTYGTADGTATAGEDYLPVSGALTFAPGETAEDVVVEVVGDLTAEVDEELFLELSSASGDGLRHRRGSGRIVTDDVLLAVERVEISEGDDHVYPVRLWVTPEGELPGSVTVAYETVDGTATAGLDYVAAAGTVVVGPGTAAGHLRVDLIGDRELEGDEGFSIRFTAPDGSRARSSEVGVTLLDDDDCPGPNLVRNGGAEELTSDGELVGWTEVVDDEWTGRTDHSPFEGERWFYAGLGAGAELAQDVDLSGYAEGIDAGTQRFQARTVVTSFDSTHRDASRMVVEYRDGPGGAILDTWDSGEHRDLAHWHLLDDVRVPPPGTRWARVRLIAKRYNGVGDDGHFDDVALRALDAPSVSIGDVAVEEGSSGERTARVPVSLSCARPAPVSVDFLTADGTARAGEDYRSAAGTVVFAPGELEKTIEVPVLGDTRGEGDETFTVRLVNPAGAALARSAATVTILDDESLVSIADVLAEEGDPAEGNLATFTVTLAPAVELPVTVAWATADGTAVAGADYEAASGTVTFEPGETVQTLDVRLLGDSVDEGDETFTVTLSAPVNAVLGAATATGTIVEDDTRLSISDGEVVEGDSGTAEMRFEITLATPSVRQVRVHWATEDDLATAGADYQAASGWVTFQPGQVAREITVDALGDTEPEPSETFFVLLDSPENGGLDDAAGTGFILDDDDCPSADLLVNGSAEEPAVAGEIPGWTEVVGNGWQAVGFGGPLDGREHFWPGRVAEAELRQDVDVSAFAPFIDAGIQRFLFQGFLRGDYHDSEPDLGRFVVEYRDGPGGAVLDSFDSGEIPAPGNAWKTVFRRISDLQPAPPGTRSIRVRLIARTVGEGDTYSHTFFDALSLRSLGTPTLAVEPVAVDEGDAGTAEADIDLLLSCAADEPVTVEYSTAAGTATPGQDYVETVDTVVYHPGEVARTLRVPVIGDLHDEPDQDLTVHLSSSANAPLVRRQTSLTIVDDDPLPHLRVDDVTVVEGHGDTPRSALFTVRSSQGSERIVSAYYQTGQGTARRNSDYLRVSGWLTFEPLQSVATVAVPLVGDTVAEPDEVFFLNLGSPKNSTLVVPTGLGTIVDDDPGASCEGPDLLTNGGGDSILEAGDVPGWSAPGGDAWGRAHREPDPAQGFAYLTAGTAAETELVQQVDLAAYAPWIDLGSQEIEIGGFVRSAVEGVPDEGRVSVEYRAADGTVLDTFDSGWIASASAWRAVGDTRTVPAGARVATLRLLARRMTGEATDVYFDGLFLRSLATPSAWSADLSLQENAALGGSSPFRIRLSCPAEEPVTVSYRTVDATATAGEDYRALSGSVVFQPGELVHEVPVEVLDDAVADPSESFVLELEAGPGAAMATPEVRGFITDDEGVVLDLALCMDGSGSISSSDFALQLGGTAAAVEDRTVIPHNGTVRISVLQFSSGSAFVVPPTIVDGNTAALLADAIRSIRQWQGATNIAACLDLASQVITEAQPPSAKQVIDLSTDGQPNRGDLKAALEAVDQRGVEALNAIGVGGGVSEAFLHGIVRPQPSGGAEGFVVVVDGFDAYSEAIAQKIRKEANPDLVVTKTDGLELVPAGAPIEYTVTVTNVGSGAVSSLRVLEQLPGDLLDPVFTPSEGTFDPATGVWTGADLGTDATVTLRVAGIVSPAATERLVNTVTVLPPDGTTDLEPTDNTATDTTEVEELVTVEVSVADATVSEGDGPALFQVTLSEPARRTLRVPWTTVDAPPEVISPATPAAGAGIDYVAGSGVLEIPAGSSGGAIGVDVVDDRVDELDEVFALVLSTPENATVSDGEALGTILDDDLALASVDDLRVDEGDAGTADALVPVRLTLPADRTVTVGYQTAEGTALEQADYLPVSGTVTFEPLETEATIAVPVVGDPVMEPLEETLTVELSEPTVAGLLDPEGVVTIVDDEDCLGPNLLANPGAEVVPAPPEPRVELPGWAEVEGPGWTRRTADPVPAEGEGYFSSGEADFSELAQEVSVQAFEVRIDGSQTASHWDEGQRFRFSGRVRTFDESPPDAARIVVEYRDRANEVVLDAFDTGEISSPLEWHEVSDERAAPAGTGWIRVRLVATRFTGPPNDGYFDALELRPLRAATLTVGDTSLSEGDSGTTDALFPVRLACALVEEVTVAYATADGTPDAARGGALAGSDYLPVSGTLTFAPGETEATVAVPVVGDTVHERHEIFFVDLSGATPAGTVVYLDPRGEGLIMNDDFCPRSPGFWKTHQDLWPTEWLVLGGVEYDSADLLEILSYHGPDAAYHLARQLVAARLNLLVGSDPGVRPVIEDADLLLAAFPPGSNPKKDDKKTLEVVKDLLDAYNNPSCAETPVIPQTAGLTSDTTSDLR